MAVKVSQLLEDLVKPIVKFPKDIKISQSKEEEIEVLTLEVNPEDVGRVIGRSGKNANAIRTLLFAAASLDGIKIKLNIKTDEK